jgi:hypothetical protein
VEIVGAGGGGFSCAIGPVGSWRGGGDREIMKIGGAVLVVLALLVVRARRRRRTSGEPSI